MGRQWLSDRICVGYLCGLESGICLSLKHVDRSWEYKHSEILRECVHKREFEWFFEFLFLEKCTLEDSGCVTEYVWGTCVDLSPGCVCHYITLAEVESIKPEKCRPCIETVYTNVKLGAIFTCLFLHKYTCDDSGCVTEYVWSTCVDLSQGYLHN